MSRSRKKSKSPLQAAELTWSCAREVDRPYDRTRQRAVASPSIPSEKGVAHVDNWRYRDAWVSLCPGRYGTEAKDKSTLERLCVSHYEAPLGGP